MLVADMPVRPIPGHMWSEDLVPIEHLARRLGAGYALSAIAPPVAAEGPADEDKGG